jgi:hypothetical protein
MFLENVSAYQIIRCHNPQGYSMHFHPFENTESLRIHKSQGAESVWFCSNVTKQFSRLLIHKLPGGDCRKQYVVMKQPTGTYASVGSVAGTFATKSSIDSSTTDSDKHIPNLCARVGSYCFSAYVYVTFILICCYFSIIIYYLVYSTFILYQNDYNTLHIHKIHSTRTT